MSTAMSFIMMPGIDIQRELDRIEWGAGYRKGTPRAVAGAADDVARMLDLLVQGYARVPVVIIYEHNVMLVPGTLYPPVPGWGAVYV